MPPPPASCAGWGRAAELIESCDVSELPPSITAFLEKIYARFPRPKVPEVFVHTKETTPTSNDNKEVVVESDVVAAEMQKPRTG